MDWGGRNARSSFFSNHKPRISANQFFKADMSRPAQHGEEALQELLEQRFGDVDLLVI